MQTAVRRGHGAGLGLSWVGVRRRPGFALHSLRNQRQWGKPRRTDFISRCGNMARDRATQRWNELHEEGMSSLSRGYIS